MKTDKNYAEDLKASKSIRAQELDLRVALSEKESECIRLAQHISKGKGISMVDYSDYNRAMASLKESTDNYLGFINKFKMSLR